MKKIVSRSAAFRSPARFVSADDASSAVEFALVAPLFILLTFGVISYGAIMSVHSAVQQLTAESARASVAGLSNTERDQLARSFVSDHVNSYPLIDPTRLSVNTTPLGGSPSGFQVTLQYDISHSFMATMGGLLPLPSQTVTRSSVVQTGF